MTRVRVALGRSDSRSVFLSPMQGLSSLDRAERDCWSSADKANYYMGANISETSNAPLNISRSTHKLYLWQRVRFFCYRFYECQNECNADRPSG